MPTPLKSVSSMRYLHVEEDAKGQQAWADNPVANIVDELKKSPAKSPRIFLVPHVSGKGNEAFVRFASNEEIRKTMVKTYHFPSNLFSTSWQKCNGFAGSERIHDANGKDIGNLSYFRILVKMIRDPKTSPADDQDYYWLELTFLIHQITGQPVTAVCCDTEDRFGPESFRTALLKELVTSGDLNPDWRYIQAALLRRMAVEVDVCVWDCSNAIRTLEKERPDPTDSGLKVDFHRHHDLLRHALHNSEVLGVACMLLKDWLEDYSADEKLSQSSSGTSGNLGKDPYLSSLKSTLRLLMALHQRSLSNEARLKNEINLAFNLVNQADTRAMRIISIVTLTFLPATFVSTLFSMTFFNYDPPTSVSPAAGDTSATNGASGGKSKRGIGRGTWTMSDQIWIYFAVALPLTILTIVLWVYGAIWWKWLEKKGIPQSVNRMWRRVTLKERKPKKQI